MPKPSSRYDCGELFVVRFARYRIDALLLECNPDGHCVVAEVVDEPIVIAAPVAEAVVLAVECNEGNNDHVEHRRIDEGVGCKGGIVVRKRSEGMIEERNAAVLVLLAPETSSRCSGPFRRGVSPCRESMP